MSRMLIIVLLSSALAFGNMSTSANAQPENQAPLPAAGAAGIKQAQGFAEENRTLIIVAIGAALVALWILLDDDEDDDVTSTTGT